MTQPAGIGDIEQTVARVWLAVLAREYATPVPAQPALLYELVMTQPAGIGDIEHTVAPLCPLTSAMVYATPVPAQPALRYELVITHPAGMGELEQTVAPAASRCGVAWACALAAVTRPRSISTTVTRWGMRLRTDVKAGLESSRRSTAALM
ncbi:hypothetical protein ACFVSN_41375 [Kitasatospora sp. NPDC057904]|uniref:hypothetical protein n=1 Tax=Kitasatospora sp. NPDC057904 TaxID=3346275 RepID=UPI0036DB08DB